MFLSIPIIFLTLLSRTTTSFILPPGTPPSQNLNPRDKTPAGVAIYADDSPIPGHTSGPTTQYDAPVPSGNSVGLSGLTLNAFTGLHCTGDVSIFHNIIWSTQNVIPSETLSWVISRPLVVSEALDWSTFASGTNLTNGPGKVYQDNTGACSQFLASAEGPSWVGGACYNFVSSGGNCVRLWRKGTDHEVEQVAWHGP